MSQRDLTVELRAARIEAPAELRARVRLIAAADTTSRRSPITWRRALVLALPVAAALAAAIVLTRPDHPQPAGSVDKGFAHGSVTATPATPATVAPSLAPSATRAIAPSPSTTRVQRYGAYLALRVPTPDGISSGVKQALSITKSLGGYAGSVHAVTSGKSGSADLVLKVPRTKVQQAIARLSAIGTITAEQVNVQDLQTSLNGTDRTIARLQRELTVLRAKPQSAANDGRIALLVRRIEALQRSQAATLREARYATIDLHLGTAVAAPGRPHHGPLHGLAVAFRWLGIGAVYGLALGVPFVLVLWLAWIAARTVRRRREDALLSRS